VAAAYLARSIFLEGKKAPTVELNRAKDNKE